MELSWVGMGVKLPALSGSLLRGGGVAGLARRGPYACKRPACRTWPFRRRLHGFLVRWCVLAFSSQGDNTNVALACQAQSETIFVYFQGLWKTSEAGPLAGLRTHPTSLP